MVLFVAGPLTYTRLSSIAPGKGRSPCVCGRKSASIMEDRSRRYHPNGSDFGVISTVRSRCFGENRIYLQMVLAVMCGDLPPGNYGHSSSMLWGFQVKHTRVRMGSTIVRFSRPGIGW